MAPTLNITHIGTATALLEINGVTFITDPFFSPAGTSFNITDDIVLTVSDDPALRLDQLPAIDAVLLSHEDHADNLDDLGRRLLDGRQVFTTIDGANKLQPRPSVTGLKPWQSVKALIGGKEFTIIGTPTKHVAGQECTGFILTSPDFGTHEHSSLPNAIYFSGDTVYIPSLAQIASTHHVCASILNLGSAHAPEILTDSTSPVVQITMDGKQAAQLVREIGTDLLVPMHYESWNHFKQGREELERVFEEEGVAEKVAWLKGGEKVGVLV